MKKKLHLLILFSISIYFLTRLAMLFAMADKNHLFIYDENDLDLLLPYADTALTVLFFFCFYHFFKTIRPMKYISIALMAFFIPFTFLVSFLYISLNTDADYSREFFHNEKLLVVVGHIKGLHPDKDSPREIYMYEKTVPFIYKKLGQKQVELSTEDLKMLHKMKVDAKELSVEINKRQILLKENK